MSKLEVIDGKQTSWEGLWWHSEYNGYSSATISLSELRKFKGNVRLYVRKNKYFNKGENKRPNYCFCLKDSKSEVFSLLEIQDEKKLCYEDGEYYTSDGDRLYTHDELQEAIDEATDGLYTYDQVQYAINRAAEDGRKGYGWGDNIVSDYL